MKQFFGYKTIYIIKHKGFVKIGISKDFNRRKAEIERSLNSSVKLLFKLNLFYCSRIEKKLHRRYSRRRIYYKGSGKTEYFRLNLIQVARIILSLIFIKIFQFLLLFAFVLSLSISIYYVIQIQA